MRHPTVVVATDHPGEQALVRFFLGQQGVADPLMVTANATPDDVATLEPDVVVVDEEVCDVVKLRAALPSAAIAALAPTGQPIDGVDAVVQRPPSLQALRAIVGPLLERERAAVTVEPRRKKVVLCDDDEDFVHWARTVLTKAGCEVTAALDAKSFVERLPDLRNVDAVLLDVRMPGIDGFQVCRFLRERQEDLRICMITATQGEEAVKQAEMAGADGWLNKPVSAKDLLMLVGLGAR